MRSSAKDEESEPKMLVRRAAGATIWIYPDTGELKINATEVRLTTTQKRLLAHLASHPGEVTLDELAKVVPAPGYPPAHHDVVKVEIFGLRQAFNKDEVGTGALIITTDDGYLLAS